MSLSQADLADGLESLTPVSTSREAAQTIADAYALYMSAALASTFPILSVVAPLAAMAGAISFSPNGSPAAAGASIQAGIVQFWATMIAAPATYFAGATAITPPPDLTSLGTALSAVFSSEVGSSLETIADAMATAIHAASVKGTAAFPPSSVFKIG